MAGLKLICFLLATTPELLRYSPESKEHYEELFATGPYTIGVYIAYKQLCLQTQDYGGLIRSSEKLIERYPGEPEPYFGLAEGCFLSNKKTQGLEVLSKLFKRDPEMTLRIGYTLERFEYWQEAIGFYERYRRLKKSDAYFSEELIRVYQFARNFPGAAAEIVRCIDRTPGSAPRYERVLASFLTDTDPKVIINEVKKMKSETDRARILARLYLRLKQYGAAAKEFKKSGSKNELTEFARLCVEAGAYEPAEEIYRKLNLRFEQAQCLRKLGKFSEAAAVVSKDRSLPSQLERAGIYLDELKNPKAAEEVYQAILHDEPGCQAAQSGLVETLVELGELKQAHDFLLRVSGKTDWAFFYKIEIGFFNGEFDSIPAYALELSQQFPESPLVNDGLELALLAKESDANLTDYARALFDCKSSRYDDGIAILKKIITQNSRLADDSYLLMARCFRGEKEPALALASLQELGKKFPQSPVLPRMRLEQAVIYQEDLKDLKFAKKTLEDLIVDYPDSPQACIARNLLLSFTKL
jgi:outer membrane protein assembly factor BamD (BamD/ComL family)